MKRKIAAALVGFITIGFCGCSPSQPQVKYVHIKSLYNIREDKVYEYNGCLKHIKVGNDPAKWILVEDYDSEHRNLKGMLVSEYLGVYDTYSECPYCN